MRPSADDDGYFVPMATTTEESGNLSTPAPPIVFLDTETTSTEVPWLPSGRRVWDLAMIVRHPGGEQLEFSWLVYDVDLRHANPYSLDVGRFFDRHPRGGPGYHVPQGVVVAEEREVAVAAYRRIPRGAHIVGAVPGFDVESLHEMAFRHGLPWVAHYHLIDVEDLAVGYLHGAVAERNAEIDASPSDRPRATAPPEASLPWDSEDISRAVGVEPAPPEERHTALGDARWAMRLYDAITGGAS